MNESNDEALAHISSHIVIRDKNTKMILLNKNLTASSRTQKTDLGDTDSKING